MNGSWHIQMCHVTTPIEAHHTWNSHIRHQKASTLSEQNILIPVLRRLTVHFVQNCVIHRVLHIYRNTLQHIATCSNAMQHTAIHKGNRESFTCECEVLMKHMTLHIYSHQDTSRPRSAVIGGLTDTVCADMRQVSQALCSQRIATRLHICVIKTSQGCT